AATFLGRLQGALGESVAVGRPGELFASDDHFMGEMAWSWWQELQQRAARELGADAVPHLLAVDAWCGVYVDARTPPLRLREDSAEAAPAASDHDAAPPRPPLARRLLGVFSRAQRMDRAMRRV